MKGFLTIILTFLCTLFLIPYLLVSRLSGFYSDPSARKEEPYKTVSVYVKAEDKVREMDMSQYLKETVAAEMPAEFEKEALKAQATAARTYLVNRIRAENKEAKEYHKGGDICTDSTHCKAWMSEEDRKNAWDREKSNEYWQKISEAVEETSGILITYEDNPISAVFHSTSSGFTENAKDVWGGDVPYLVSVESKGEEASPRYRSQVTMTLEEFKTKASQNIEGINWDKGILENIQRSEAGGIKTLDIGGVTVKGSLFRSIYGLRSANADIIFEGGNVVIDVTGFGHGVGMSQYGANYLASQGYGYKEILKTYYSGVEIS